MHVVTVENYSRTRHDILYGDNILEASPLGIVVDWKTLCQRATYVTSVHQNLFSLILVKAE